MCLKRASFQFIIHGACVFTRRWLPDSVKDNTQFMFIGKAERLFDNNWMCRVCVCMFALPLYMLARWRRIKGGALIIFNLFVEIMYLRREIDMRLSRYYFFLLLLLLTNIAFEDGTKMMLSHRVIIYILFLSIIWLMVDDKHEIWHADDKHTHSFIGDKLQRNMILIKINLIKYKHHSTHYYDMRNMNLYRFN